MLLISKLKRGVMYSRLLRLRSDCIWLQVRTRMKGVSIYAILYWKDASRPAVTSIHLIPQVYECLSGA